MEIRPIDAKYLLENNTIYDVEDEEGDIIDHAISVGDIEDAPTLSLNTLRDAIYQDAVAHGLWEEADAYSEKYSQMCGCGIEKEMCDHMKNCCASGLVLSEAEEMYDAAETDNWNAVQEELADVIIMAMSAAGYLGIDIDTAIRRKMEINHNRPWKHGKE